MEGIAKHSLAILARALHGKETYIVRLPYPHAFQDLYAAIRPFCKSSTAATPESLHALA
jgi:hypothetical protein